MTNCKAPLSCDGLIFDMDGTLWDAVDSYVKIWNATIAECGIHRAPVTRDELIAQMGKPLDVILPALIPGAEGHKPGLLEILMRNEAEMMPRLGGKLYPDVRGTLERLHGRIPLFMVSNCGAEGLENFLTFTGLRHFFIAWLSNGATGQPKDANIRALVERYNMDSPYYVGDTATDEKAARSAGTGMIWCRYGFGHAENPDYVIDSFARLTSVPPVANRLSD